MPKFLLKTSFAIKSIFLTVIFFLMTVDSYAQPSNDDYANAIDVSSLINGCSVDAFYTTVNATPDLNVGSNWNNNGPIRNVWFSFVATTTEINITVDIGGTKGTQSRSQLALWEADGITELESDNYYPVFTGNVDVNVGYVGLTIGNTYYISMDGHTSNSQGTFTLCLEDSVDYDFYEGAIDVDYLINSCSNDAEFSTDGAAPDKNAGLHWNTSGSVPVQNRWFKFTATSSDQFNITVDIGNVSGGAKGDQYRTQIAVWEADGITEVSSTRYDVQYANVTLGVPGLTPNNTYYISIDSTSESAAGSFTLCLDAKDKEGNIVINEVFFKETASGATNNDEFIELYNAGITAVDIAGWQLMDGNLFVIGETDYASSITGDENPFTFSCSGSEVCAGTTLLQPGAYAVIWIGEQTASKDAANAVFQAWLGGTTKLNDTGDDIWLYDTNTTLIDYVAYGANGQLNQPPLPFFWDNSVQATLATVSSGQSISLSLNGIDGNSSNCWEPSTSAQASVNCVGYLPTVDSDGSTRIASTGESNNGPDTDDDGIVDSVDLDDDNDGILDTVETTSDLDLDGLINSLDLDADGDGIPDNVEAQSSIGYIAPNADTPLDYVTNNGVNSAYLGGLTPENTDGTDTPDYLDTDADNEGGNDTLEAALTLANNDTDNDGLDDNSDATNDYSDSGGTIDNPILTLPDIDVDASIGGDVDYRDAIDNRPDNDLDGIVDVIDLDDDNDGILDCDESQDSVADQFGWTLNTPTGTFDADDFYDPKISDWVLSSTGTMIISNMTQGSTAVPDLQIESALASSFAEAYNQNKYIEVSFTTASSLSKVLLKNVRSGWYQPADRGDSYYSTVLITEQGTANWETLSSDVFHTDDGSSYLGMDHMEANELLLKPNSTYILRIYMYGQIDDSPKNFSVFDDFRLLIEACQAVDTDGNGQFDHLETDSDGDGCADALEGTALNSQIGFANLDANNQITGGVDSNGVPNLASGGQAGGTAYDATQQADECSTCNINNPDYVDTDGDLIGDTCDLDDDNDGILDANECLNTTTLATNGDFSGWIYSSSWTGDSWEIDAARAYYAQWNGAGLKIFEQVINVTSGTENTITFDVGSNAGYTNESTLNVKIDGVNQFTESSTDISAANSGNASNSNATLNMGARSIAFTPTSNTVTLTFEGTATDTNHDTLYVDNVYIISGCTDYDGDGIANIFDLDSDNDGIYDLDEAGHDEVHTDGRLTGAVGANGLADVVETTLDSGIITYSVTNSDGTDTPDFLDTDSDNDGCSDANEAYGDANADGGDNEYYGTGTPPSTNANGAVIAASYALPVDSDANNVYDYQEVGEVPEITIQPLNTTTCPGCNVTITVIAIYSDMYQWQLFDGASWVDLSNSGSYTGTTTASLNIIKATPSDNGNQYRVLTYNSAYICNSDISNEAILIVNVSSVITNRRITHRVKKN